MRVLIVEDDFVSPVKYCRGSFFYLDANAYYAMEDKEGALTVTLEQIIQSEMACLVRGVLTAYGMPQDR